MFLTLQSSTTAVVPPPKPKFDDVDKKDTSDKQNNKNAAAVVQEVPQPVSKELLDRRANVCLYACIYTTAR